MAQQRNGDLLQEETDKRQERADRILDVASELIQRWGYRKTTIDDIAKHAGVAKGTIYLHWKTRDDLFIALLMREKVREAKHVQQEMAQDPDGMTLHTMAKYSVMTGLRNPLMKAVILRDTAVLGDIIHKALEIASISDSLNSLKTFLAYMRSQGMIRADISIEAQIHLYESIILGALIIDQYLPEDLQLPIAERANLVSETVRRTFEIRNPTQAETQASIGHFEQMLTVLEEFKKE